MLVGKKNLDINSKIILGVDLLHRAQVSIKSNGRQFTLIAHMLRDNGLKSRVKLQQHVWSKNIELDGGSRQSNSTTEMIANSEIFFSCKAQLRNKKFIGATVDLQPLYSITWQNKWPLVANSNLLLIKNCEYNIATNKKIKLQIDHTINHTVSTENRSDIEPSTSLHTVGTKTIYNEAALNIDLLGICPSIHSSSNFTKNPGKDPDYTQQLDSCSLILEPSTTESPGSRVKEEEVPQASHIKLPGPISSHLHSQPEKINISIWGTCHKILSKCECNVRFTI